MIGRASTPFLALQGERIAQDGFKMVRSVVLGGNLSRVAWQDGFPPDNPNMGALPRVSMLGLSTRCNYAQSTPIEGSQGQGY